MKAKMRLDFRVKTDLSKIYQDVRQHSWIYVDSTKIFQVNHLADHIRKLFDIKKPFHLLSKFDETLYFLPFEEDVRILQNNDTVLVMPCLGSINSFRTENEEQVCEVQNGFVEPSTSTTKNSNIPSERSSIVNQKSFEQGLDNSSVTDTVSINDSFYRTALHETIVNNTEESKMNEDLTDSNSVIENSAVSNKRKRVRKKKQKKQSDVIAETDTSGIELTSKKPKIIDSVLISSGKHIRFEGIDNEEETSENNVCNGSNFQQVKHKDFTNKQPINKDLTALLSLRKSSTPLTFSHKRVKREFIPQSISENGLSMEISETENVNSQKPNVNYSAKEVKENSIKEYNQINESSTNNNNNETVSFKVFKFGEDYTPQVSSVILAKVLNHDEEMSQYTFQILHGREQLQEPDGKFSLPKEETENDNDDIVVLEQSKLLEFTKVKPV